MVKNSIEKKQLQAALKAAFNASKVEETRPTTMDLKEEIGQSFTIIKFPDSPWKGATTICTLGLANYIGKDVDDGNIRQELMFTAISPHISPEVTDCIYRVAEKLRRENLEVGNAIPPVVVPFDSVIEEGGTIWGVTLYVPLELEDPVISSFKPPIHLQWLLPLTKKEVEYVINTPVAERAKAGSALIKQFQKHEINCYNLCREDVALPPSRKTTTVRSMEPSGSKSSQFCERD